MGNSFPSQVNVQPAVGVAGDFCDANPRATLDAGPGGLVAGPNGLYVGRFAWISAAQVDGDNAPALANNYGAGPVAGFVHRDQQGLITEYLQNASMKMQAGFQATLFTEGGFWVVNDGTTSAVRGQKVYANYADGKATAAAAGSPAQGASVTAAIAATAGSFTGSIAGDVMTITAVGSGVAVVGGLLSGSGVASGTRILAQLSGTAGGVGTYRVSILQTVDSTTISETYGLMTVASVGSGVLSVGDVLAGANVTSGNYITAFGTGTGGTGTYITAVADDATSTTITATKNVETKWYVMSPAIPGDLMKISSWPQG